MCLKLKVICRSGCRNSDGNYQHDCDYSRLRQSNRCGPSDQRQRK